MTPGGPYAQAMFEGLVVDEDGHAVRAVQIGGVAHYVIESQGFERHVEAEPIDRAVLAWIKEQALANQDEVTRGMLGLLGRDDLFTKAMIDAQLKNMDQRPTQPLPEEARAWLGMLGFRIVVDLHGAIVRLDLPGAVDPDAE